MTQQQRNLGTVPTSKRIMSSVKAELEEMAQEEFQRFAKLYPATLIAAGINPIPYLKNIKLEEVLEYVVEKLKARGIVDYPEEFWHPSEGNSFEIA